MAIDWTDGRIDLSEAGKEALDKFVGEISGREPDTLEKAKRRSEYWKAEHAAANVEIERLRTLARDASMLAECERCIQPLFDGYQCHCGNLIDLGDCVIVVENGNPEYYCSGECYR